MFIWEWQDCTDEVVGIDFCWAILIFIWLPGSFSSQLPRVGDVFTHPTFNLYNRESL